jgi:hypothetical protein
VHLYTFPLYGTVKSMVVFTLFMSVPHSCGVGFYIS